MLDAAKRGGFSCLLAWDLARIGRFDSMDAGKWLSTLRDAGVVIVTSCDGTFDLNEPFDRMKLGWQSEGNNAENVKRAASVTRGQLDVALKGVRCGARPPYGFRRGQYDADGNLVKLLEPKQSKDRKEHFVGPVLDDSDSAKHEAIKRIFERYASAKLSFSEIAQEMKALDYPSPGRKRGWVGKHCQDILRQPLYAGMLRWGARSAGRYYTTENGEVSKRPQKDMPTESHPDSAVIVPSPCEGIIPRKLWEKVQRKMAGRTVRKPRPGTAHPLSSMLICKHCGRPMHFRNTKCKRNGRVYEYNRFVCATYREEGSRGECGHYTIDSDRVLGWLVAILQSVFQGPGRPAAVKKMKALLKSEATPKRDVGRLEKRLKALDGDIARLRKAIRRSECRWKKKPGKRRGFVLERGRVVLKDHLLFRFIPLGNDSWSLGPR